MNEVRPELHLWQAYCEKKMELEDAQDEIKRLRIALLRWQNTGCPDCGGDCGDANPPVICCIMQETRAALGERDNNE